MTDVNLKCYVRSLQLGDYTAYYLSSHDRCTAFQRSVKESEGFFGTYHGGKLLEECSRSLSGERCVSIPPFDPENYVGEKARKIPGANSYSGPCQPPELVLKIEKELNDSLEALKSCAAEALDVRKREERDPMLNNLNIDSVPKVKKTPPVKPPRTKLNLNR
ncbi:hypothetical protein [uncultured Endozoicomonas sp.]|uniref:hypothetical protein n=1 Tax=uncultured Endozoicomonas sp. TaxID=432652 RepID=UPI00262652AE|nr:hypothetical protein [uncultured Endozoicomonas sp.]